MRRKVIPILISVVLMTGLLGCVGNSVTLTSDQEARIVLNSIQENLNTTYDVVKAQLLTRPNDWKKAHAAIDATNRTLKDAIELARKGNFTMADVKAKINPLMNRLMILLGELGVKL